MNLDAEIRAARERLNRSIGQKCGRLSRSVTARFAYLRWDIGGGREMYFDEIVRVATTNVFDGYEWEDECTNTP